MSGFPIVLNAERVTALVVGGGRVGTRRALALAEAGAAVRVIAPRLSAELVAARATAPGLTLEAREFEPSDVRGAHVVIAATDSSAVNRRVAEAARDQGALCNVADDADAGTFWTAAVHRSGPLLLAVSAGGVPSAAARVRDALAACVDERLGDAVERLRALRERLLAAGDGEGWRRAAAELTGPDFVASVESGAFAERVRQWT